MGIKFPTYNSPTCVLLVYLPMFWHLWHLGMVFVLLLETKQDMKNQIVTINGKRGEYTGCVSGVYYVSMYNGSVVKLTRDQAIEAGINTNQSHLIK